MRSRSAILPRACILFCACLALSCGAENQVAPRVQRSAAAINQCRSFEQLMPRFSNALATGKTEGLRQMLADQVLQSERQGVPPAMMVVLRSVFTTFGKLAQAPAERGAPSNDICAENPPPVAQAHPLCEMRRAMQSLVHQGQGINAVQIVDPMLTSIFKYMLGQAPAATVPHFEVATVINRMCAQNGVCQLNDTLDLVIAVTAFAQTSEGVAALNDTRALLRNPALQPFLTNNSEQYGGENGVTTLVRLVLQTVQGMDDPSDLDALPVSAFPDALRADAQRGIANLKKLLDPKREPNVLRPLQKASTCLSASDQNLDAVRMFYRLWFDAKIADFSFANFVDVMAGLRDTDSRGSLLQIIRTLATAVRQDEEAVAASARVCQLVFTKENAQRAMPEVTALFQQGVVSEAVCAVDTLVFGCVGGTAQPACQPPATK